MNQFHSNGRAPAADFLRKGSAIRRLFLSFVFVLLFILASFFISRAIVGKVKQYTAWVDHTRQVITGFTVLQNQFKSAQMYSRHYDSLMQIPLMRQYKKDALLIPVQLNTLRQLTIDNRVQTALIDSLSLLIDAQYATLLQKNLVEIFQGGEAERFQAFSTIALLIDQGIRNEEKLLVVRRRKLQKGTLALTYSLTGLAVTLVLIFVFLFLYVARKRNLLQGFLGSVLDSASDTIISYRPLYENDTLVDFRIAYVNKAGLLAFDKNLAAVFGSTLNERRQERGTDLLPQFREVFESGIPCRFEVSYSQNGADRHFLGTATRQNKRITACYNEVTDLKKATIALAATNKALVKSNEELGRFVFVASHDLKEPVRKATFFFNNLLHVHGNGFSSHAKEISGKVQLALQRMRDMIEGVSLYATISQAAPEYTGVSLQSITEQVIVELSNFAQEKNATLRCYDLPDIEGDEKLLRQLMYQLLHNAIRFSKPGQPQIISIREEKIEEEQSTVKNKCKVVIEDHGIGFLSQLAPELFLPFRRKHSKDEFEGAGLGLALCQQIVDLHRGSITAQADVGKGATFIVELPRAKPSI